VLKISLAFVAGELQQVITRLRISPELKGHFPRPRVERGILECGFVPNRICIGERVPLDNVKRGTGEVPGHIEPRLAVEIRRIHDERIAFPPAH